MMKGPPKIRAAPTTISQITSRVFMGISCNGVKVGVVGDGDGTRRHPAGGAWLSPVGRRGLSERQRRPHGPWRDQHAGGDGAGQAGGGGKRHGNRGPERR